MEKGDRIEVTMGEAGHFETGDLATLTHKDEEGDWWADFDEREWGSGDRSFCLQRGLSEFKVLSV